MQIMHPEWSHKLPIFPLFARSFFKHLFAVRSILSTKTDCSYLNLTITKNSVACIDEKLFNFTTLRHYKMSINQFITY